MEPKALSDKQKEVYEFIDKFYETAYAYEIEHENLRKLFCDGYCYYFASMLKAAFLRGSLFITAPYGHVVWRDEDGNCYDAMGIYISGDVTLVPVSDPIVHDAADFRHVRTNFKGTTKEEIEYLISKYKNAEI